VQPVYTRADTRFASLEHALRFPFASSTETLYVTYLLLSFLCSVFYKRVEADPLFCSRTLTYRNGRPIAIVRMAASEISGTEVHCVVLYVYCYLWTASVV
jgi:hypothetical protein